MIPAMTDRPDEHKWPHEDGWREVPLPTLGTQPAHRHLFQSRTVWAVKAALGAERPLLVRGEPGTGKSELARAVAQVLERPLITEVITARTESQDLLFRFDAVARLGQAQVLAATGGKVEDLAESNFVQPGPLWWAFDWDGARTQHQGAKVKGRRPSLPPGWDEGRRPEHGTVLLIDEIDKADADVPNGLLESLGNGAFGVPYRDEAIACTEGAAPLVVITTNEERELPAAFVRRCFVLELKLPQGKELEAQLIDRGSAHFEGSNCSKELYETAAHQLVEDRQAAASQGKSPPGQAEYLDLLRAVLSVAGDDANEQLRVLGEMKKYAFDKHPAESL